MSAGVISVVSISLGALSPPEGARSLPPATCFSGMNTFMPACISWRISLPPAAWTASSTSFWLARCSGVAKPTWIPVDRASGEM